MDKHLTEVIKKFHVEQYGTEKLGKLKSVMLHTPKTSLNIINKRNFKYYLFNEAPNYQKFIKEHLRYSEFLKSLGLEVLELSSFVNENIEINFKTYMANKGIELVNITNKEQINWGCSFIPLEPNVIIHYDFSLSTKTQRQLHNLGVKIIKFTPESALLAGGGSLRCLTLRLYRKD